MSFLILIANRRQVDSGHEIRAYSSTGDLSVSAFDW